MLKQHTEGIEPAQHASAVLRQILNNHARGEYEA